MTDTIRRAQHQDLDQIAPLFDAYRRFYGQRGDLARAREFLAERLQSDESVVLLAERDGSAVGFVQLFPMFSSVRTARVWVLNDLYVDEGARRGGIGRSLLEAAESFAREDGAARMVLETSQDNDAARALYRSAGWQEESTQWYGLALQDMGD